MLKKSLLFAFFLSLTTFLSANPENPWRDKAKISGTFIEKTLRENHPGALGEKLDEFFRWVDKEAEMQIDEKLTHVSDENSYQLFLTWCTKGFNAGHISAQFSNQIPQATEWAGLLMSYNPHQRRFLLSETVDSLLVDQLPDCRGYNVVSHIDEIPTAEWISKNIIPYQSEAVAGLESAYVKAAPLALTWANNPFIKKPTTITVEPSSVAFVHSRGPGGWGWLPRRESIPKKLTLDWKPIEQDELSAKISDLHNLSKDKRATLQLSHDKVNFQWAGWILNYEAKSNKFYVDPSTCNYPIDPDPYVTHIDGIPTAKWISNNILPHQPDATTKPTSDYKKAAPLALTWPTNLLKKRPTTITLVHKKPYGSEYDPYATFSRNIIDLDWVDISPRELSEKTKTKLIDISTHNAYVRIPSFAQSVASSLHQVAQHIKEARSCRSITFDLRGNTGGSPFFGTTILKNLYGEKYFNQKIFKATRKEKVLWRASKGNIAFLENPPHASRLSEKEKAFLAKKAANLQKALDDGEEFFTEEAVEKNTIKTQPPASTKVTAKVYVIIDAQCVGAALDFIDQLKAITGGKITLIGQPTSADSIYAGQCSVKAPKEIDPTLTLNYPMKMYKNRTRGHNQPYVPDISVDSKTLNNDALLRKRILTAINNNFVGSQHSSKFYSTDFCRTP